MVQLDKPAPDFVIVGGPKCGTTALFATLRQHPQLALSKIKEPRFFASDYPGRRDRTDWCPGWAMDWWGAAPFGQT